MLSEGYSNELAVETVPLGSVFKPGISASIKSPPRKKAWNSPSKPCGKISRPTSSLGRPASSLTGSASVGQLSRPLSGMSDKCSQSALVSRSSSASQLTRCTSKFPPMPKQALSFDDLYSLAKQRVAVKSAHKRKERQKHAYSSPTTSSRLASALKPIESSVPVAPVGTEQPITAEELQWAAAILGPAEDEEDDDERPDSVSPLSVVADLPQEASFDESSRRPSASSSRPSASSSMRSPSIRSPSMRSSVLLATPSHRPRRSTRRTTSSTSTIDKWQVRSFSTQDDGTPKSPTKRNEAHAASMAYVRALRSMLGDGDFNHARLDALSAELRKIVADGTNVATQDAEDDFFPEDEIQRMRVAFRRFKNPNEPEIHMDDLPQVLSFLGYMKVDKSVTSELCASITHASMLDWQEYIEFMEKFATYENSQFRTEFEEYDHDGSGLLSFDEVRDVIVAIGVTPLQDALQEAMSVVDFDGSGHLDFGEFVHLIAIYRITEGFTRKEVCELKALFDRVAIPEDPRTGEPKHIKADRLGDLMARWFGPQSADLAHKLARRFTLGESTDCADGGGSGCHKRRLSAFGGLKALTPEANSETSEQGFGAKLVFSEFLLWARRLREAEIQEFRKQFQAHDPEGLGKISDVKETIKSLGYMPLQTSVDEVLAQVDRDGNGELDFEEFVHLVYLFRRTDGFTRAEVAELTFAFDQYKRTDRDGDEVVYSLELLEILRSMGYVTNIDVVRRFIKEVDFDGSNSLELPEFLRLMRLHRESELHKALDVFTERQEVKELPSRRSVVEHIAVMPTRLLRKALHELGYDPHKETLEAALVALEVDGKPPNELDYDQFVCVIDACRKALIEIRRRHAGFSEQEVKAYRESYDVYDEDGNGDIEKHELTNLLKDLGIVLRRKDDQNDMLVKIDTARAEAKASGVEENLLGSMGSPSVTFFTMLFLIRLILSASDQVEVSLDHKIQELTGFSPNQIAEFREVFTHWAVKAAKLDKSAPDVTMGPRKSFLDEPTAPAALGAADAEKEVARNLHLTADGMKRVVKSLGVHLTMIDQHLMQDKLEVLEYEGNEEAAQPKVKDGKYDFFHFLLFMKWMLDTNFANINELVQPKDDDNASSGFASDSD